MALKYTMSQAEIVEAMMQWLQRKGYTVTNGKFVINQWDHEVKAEFTIHKN
ncbi:hypothetical protein [Bacillus haynesii]|uniref:hypothetical protein n=1 Tax=Bacillus haynesii TaxID=1925021 RepID=UPI002283033B|nr:hypothetical protein [Bacillus haynesii]MCY9274543.1 hypothetical protein [Bacillus haynesii]MCY9372655.1 hypothetical protein [Bacillus haynesii]